MSDWLKNHIQHRMIHRDVKPENVLYSEREGVAKLCDFGFARPCAVINGERFTGNSKIIEKLRCFLSKRVNVNLTVFNPVVLERPKSQKYG